MQARIHFRINDETKQLAHKAAERKGLTLSDACRTFTEELAEEQKKIEEHENWLKREVNSAFDKLSNGDAVFFDQKQAKNVMEERKSKIREKYRSIL
ncbi:type II toxin-antitoxin system RelB/DinJ family antitoxin [Xenorhabdus bovienii]|uniref:type II toxin-antitoxin system RelB/DinJ family antitoxin n=1 Tax=Xenorhabdus bovienii TaxID=40576 RepID=UPI00237CDAAB|nr:type II toxin-antitoxin system RelB/DinJ family antitoxin [Xenorhabdus bovienii]MDE1497077.1 type II toxin-antitoxin system RelB/DinJ family antitoxin [Xenorhabdus bovienii]MDE9447476.1 type II toxin-antitoxin system RelB/DinJ family antitoxin [Xenorhabdus bovienii]MDE9475020.1 type II toxin-antitoxin system RelB/DinJ family antitoxin [Xenorhabdus bovienii]